MQQLKKLSLPPLTSLFSLIFSLSFSDSQQIIAKEREEKLGMPFMAAYASGVSKEVWLSHRRECLSDAAYSKAVKHVQALCSDGITVTGQKNHNQAPELTTLRGKKNLTLFDLAVSEKCSRLDSN